MPWVEVFSGASIDSLLTTSNAAPALLSKTLLVPSTDPDFLAGVEVQMEPTDGGNPAIVAKDAIFAELGGPSGGGIFGRLSGGGFTILP